MRVRDQIAAVLTCVVYLAFARVVAAETTTITLCGPADVVDTRINPLWGNLNDSTNDVIGAPDTLMRFDLSSIPAGSTVTSATLTLSAAYWGSLATYVTKGDFPLNIFRVTQAWTPAASYLTYDGTHAWPTKNVWNNVVGTNGQTLTTVAGLSAPYASNSTAPTVLGQPYTWDLTSLVNGWVSGTSANNGLLLNVPSGLAFFSTNADEAWKAPYIPTLTITYNTVPEPGTTVLCATLGKAK